MRKLLLLDLVLFLLFSISSPADAWFDETHIAIAKAAGYSKWFNAAGPDMIKEKMYKREDHNHYVNNPSGTIITPEMVLAQVGKYNQIDEHGHLYGAIIASVREYFKKKSKEQYAEYQLAFCSHYVGDLSQPLHNIGHSPFNKARHKEMDGIVNDEILDNLEKIKVYPIRIDSEEDLAKEIARIANQAMTLGYKLEAEDRLLSKEEAYQQLSNSASLFKAILQYVARQNKSEK